MSVNRFLLSEQRYDIGRIRNETVEVCTTTYTYRFTLLIILDISVIFCDNKLKAKVFV